jgi:hypothetical protein
MINADYHNLFFNAISIGLTANYRIAYGGIGKIHSVFEHVINIILLDHLISIVGTNVGMGPLNIVINIPDDLDFTLILKKGDPISLDEDINVGDSLIIISMEGVQLWEPSVNLKERILSNNTILDNIEILRETALASDKHGGFGELIGSAKTNEFEISKENKFGPIAKYAAPHILSLLEAISLERYDDILQSSNKIVGLGPGLTPSGDDMLIGMMVAMFYISENKEISLDVKQINNEIISGITGRTTLISEEFLREAAMGRVNEPIAILMDNILSADKKEIVESVANVLSIGSSSGVDTIFGIILGSIIML